MAAWTVLILLGCVEMLKACSLVEAPHIYTMTEILDMAPIVVYGKNIHHNFTEEPFFKFNRATFEVYCIFKSKDVTISNIIYLDDMVNPNTCSGSYVEVNETYVVALEAVIGGDEDLYKTYEPEAKNNATFPATMETLALTANLCGMPDANVHSGGNLDQCPKRTLFFDDNCTETSTNGTSTNDTPTNAAPRTVPGIVNVGLLILSVLLLVNRAQLFLFENQI